MASAFVSAFVAACLGLSAVHKWRDPKTFAEAVAEFSLLRRLPANFRSLLVWLVPLMEGAVAVLLVTPQTDRVGSVLAIGLALSFVLVVAFDSRPAIVHCGCWGGAADVPKSFVLVRSCILLAAATIAAAFVFGSSVASAWDWMLEFAAFALTAPFALLLLELPRIGQIVVIQRLSRGVRT
jgi:hypothetical protein